MSFRLWLLIFALALAAAGTWWLLQHVAPPAMQKPAPPTHTPDYYFTDATVTTLNAQGKPEAIMTAPRMVHHPDDDSVEVFSPRIKYFQADSRPWHVQADHGLLPSGGKLIYLDGHVEMTHASATGGPPLIIHTDKISVNLNTNIATTTDPAEILQGNSRTTTVGMQANLKDNHLVLESNVRGFYVHKP
ncbi:MAG: LPS export ABC transporter periplasmic protein LptC [Gammaproteobacteria bacterium]